jgi:uncharacterized Zn finger protein
MESEVRCEMCGTKMYPNMLNEYKTGNVVAVHVCPNCGLVTRDSDEQPVDMFHHDRIKSDDELLTERWDRLNNSREQDDY